MAGKSSCGKTEIWRTLSKVYNFIRIINGPQLSYDGWKRSYHLKAVFWDEPKETVERLIIVFDKADKMLESAIASGGTDVARMVQNFVHNRILKENAQKMAYTVEQHYKVLNTMINNF